MKKTLSLLLTIAVGVFTGACSGKLSASKAEQLIKEKYFGSHDELTCTLASTVCRTSSAVGQMSRRNTGLPSRPVPIGSWSMSMSVVPANA